MTSLARYHSRSPRYILDTSDNHLIRLSGADRLAWEESTVLKNVSLTGLSFSAPRDLSPQLGEIIKIQFQVPGSQMMACYGLVIRIEASSEFENDIAIHFYKLDRVQRVNLVQGLAQKMTADRKQNSDPKDKFNYEPKANTTSATASRQVNWTNVHRLFMVVTMVTCLMVWLTLLKVFWL